MSSLNKVIDALGANGWSIDSISHSSQRVYALSQTTYDRMNRAGHDTTGLRLVGRSYQGTVESTIIQASIASTDLESENLSTNSYAIHAEFISHNGNFVSMTLPSPWFGVKNLVEFITVHGSSNVETKLTELEEAANKADEVLRTRQAEASAVQDQLQATLTVLAASLGVTVSVLEANLELISAVGHKVQDNQRKNQDTNWAQSAFDARKQVLEAFTKKVSLKS